MRPGRDSPSRPRGDGGGLPGRRGRRSRVAAASAWLRLRWSGSRLGARGNVPRPVRATPQPCPRSIARHTTTLRDRHPCAPAVRPQDHVDCSLRNWVSPGRYNLTRVTCCKRPRKRSSMARGFPIATFFAPRDTLAFMEYLFDPCSEALTSRRSVPAVSTNVVGARPAANVGPFPLQEPVLRPLRYSSTSH